MIYIYILAIYAFSYYIRNLSGPFNLFGRARNYILTNQYLGIFFYQLINCPYCLGFHCGYAIYLLQCHHFRITEMILWGLAGSTITAIGDVLLQAKV